MSRCDIWINNIDIFVIVVFRVRVLEYLLNKVFIRRKNMPKVRETNWDWIVSGDELNEVAVTKCKEGEEILESMRKGYVNCVISTRDVDSIDQETDGTIIRICAVENNIAMFTALDTVRVLLDVLEEITLCISTIDE